MKKIKRLEVAIGSGCELFEVGTNGVDRIEDESIVVLPDNTGDINIKLCTQFSVFNAAGEMIKKVLNCPVIITYESS